jgi:hypothetical protein
MPLQRVNPWVCPSSLLNYSSACSEGTGKAALRARRALGAEASDTLRLPAIEEHDVVVHGGAKSLLTQLSQLIAYAGGILEFKVARMLKHLLLQLRNALAQVLL